MMTLLAAAAAIALSGSCLAALGGYSYIWTGTAGDGLWNNPNNWSPVGVPDASDTAFIPLGASLISSSNTAVGTTNNGTLGVALDRTLRLGGTISNSGTILLENSNSFIDIDSRLAAPVLTGGGVLRLAADNAGIAALNGNFAGGTLTNQDNSIRGFGAIGGGWGFNFVNNGALNADVSGRILRLTAPTSGTGTYTASNGGILQIEGDVTGGVFAGPASGGTVWSANGTLINATNTGTLGVALDRTLRLGGTISNSGTILLENSNSFIDIDSRLAAPVLTGGGVLRLAADNAGIAALNGNFAGGTLTNQDNSIRGFGAIGGGWGFNFVNNGALNADVSGRTLSILTSNFVNSGTLAATNGGILSVPGGYAQTAGVTRVANGSMILAGNSPSFGTIQIGGGRLEGSGIIAANVSNAGTISPGNSVGILSISGDLTLANSANLQIELGGRTQGTQYDLLSVAGTAPLTLDGTLSVFFVDGFQLTIQASDTFAILNSNAAILGIFSNVAGGRISTADNLGNFAVSLSGSNVILRDFIATIPPVLTLSLPQATVLEGGALNGTISIDKVLTQDITVSLGITQAGRLTFPASVLIPAGQTSKAFAITAIQNQNVEAPVDVTLIASAPGSTAVFASLRILDDDTPAIQFTLDRTMVSENAGANAVIGTLTLDRAVGSAVSASFTATPAGQVSFPASVTIPANTQTIPVPIATVDNALLDGNRAVTITAHLVGTGGTIVADAAPVALTIIDDEGSSLSFSFDRTLFIEGRNQAGSGMVTRKLATGAPVVVSLTSSSPAKFIVPATVTIPAGQLSATFAIQTINDGVPNGNQTITLMATATGLNPGTASVILTDLQKPDLTIALLDPLAGAETDAWVDVRILMTNQGGTDARGPFTQRILLSSNDTIGNDVLLGSADFTGLLPAGAYIEQSLRVRLPRTAVRFWLVAQTDANNTIDEALEDNNAAIAATPLDLAPAYTATLSIVPDTVPTGTPIPITGTATLRSGGAAAFMLVNIHITNAGIERVISALTNSLGQFSTTFLPLPGEGGLLQFGAAHPGATTFTVQDEVRVYGVKAEPASVELDLAENSSQTGSITIRNSTDLPVSGLAVSVSGLPAGIQFTPALAATTIAASGTVAINYTVASQSPFDRKTFTLSLTSTQGAAVAVPIGVTVASNTPKLVADPATLAAGMLRGGQQLVNFTLRNDGKAASGPINVLLPSGASWMKVATALPIPALAPGASVPVTIQLTPPADLALGDFSGNLGATDGANTLSIPFSFRALSDQTGQLIVHTEDEYTYFAAGNPPLAGATVTVTDALTLQVVATLTTDSNGVADFGTLREGYYTITGTADRHASYRGTQLVKPGVANDVRAFLSRQTVTYTWKVEPVETADRYKVTVETTFETNVPAPVVVVEPTVFDLRDFDITQEEQLTQITIRNEGLIAVNDVKLNLPTSEFFFFEPLVENVGILGAKSSITIPIKIKRVSPSSKTAPVVAEYEIGARRALIARPVVQENGGCGRPDEGQTPPAPGATPLPVVKPIDCFLSATVCGSVKPIGQIHAKLRDNTEEEDGVSPFARYIKPYGITANYSLDPSIRFRSECRLRWLQIIKDEDPEGPIIVDPPPCRPVPDDPTRTLDFTTDDQPWYHNSEFPRQNNYSDKPTIEGPGRPSGYRRAVSFTTMLVLESKCAGAGQFVILGGFTTAFGPAKVKTLGGIPYEVVLPVPYSFDCGYPNGADGDAKIQAALGSTGFNGWTPASSKDIACCIQPNDDYYKTCKNAPKPGNVLDNDPLLRCCTVEVIKLPEHGELINGGLHPDGSFIYKPNCDYVGWDSFTYRVRYPNGTYSDPPVTTANIAVLPCVLDGPVTYSYKCGNIIPCGVNLRFIICPTCTTCTGQEFIPSPGNGNGYTAFGGRVIFSPVSSEGQPCNRSSSPAPEKTIALRAVSVSNVAQAASSDGGVCARVKLRLDQDAVIARDAFRATLEVTNTGASQLENVRVDVTVRAQPGGTPSNLFGVTLAGVSGLSAVDGTGVLAANGVGTAKWQIVPTVDAAPTVPTQFFVGGTLRYRVDGLDVSIPFYDIPITVLPTPRLALKYFHQRDVFSDDPFTPQIEPAIPYSLAVMVKNNGFGTAKNMRITSAQPIIIENEKGLLVDFRIIATQVSGQPLVPSLTADFGEVGPGQIKVGEWLFTSSLQGLFIDYKATFEHVDGLNNLRLSLIDSVEIHEMIHQVRALGALNDGLPDFLVNDVADARDLPDTIHLSDGTTAPVAVVEAAGTSGPVTPTQLSITLTAPLPAGWAYLRIPEPSNGQYELTRVVRSDGLDIPLDVDSWVTDRTFIGQGKRPIYEAILHLLDRNSTGSYTLTYQVKLGPDTQPPTSHVKPLAAQSAIEFPVSWEGSDNRRVAFHDLYVSIDGGPYALWLQRSQESGAIYRGDLGHTYAFQSRATDGAGNLEAAHATADATTQVTLTNIAPTLAAIPDQEINEGQTLVIELAATDPDGRGDLLRFAFASAVPPGLTINSQTGQIRWVTGEADGGRGVPVDVTVTDSGLPALSATRSFVIRVIDVNSPPTLQDVPPQRVSPGSILSVQLQASDADLPVQTIRYRFATTPPPGMTINDTTGLITWQTGPSDASRVLLVSVAAADSGTPQMEALLSFPVTVDPVVVDRPPQFYATGGQIWLAGTVHTFQVNAFDPDGDAVKLTLDKTGLPGSVTFSSTDGTGLGLITWNTTGVTPGIYSLPLQATSQSLQAGYSPAVKIVTDNAYWKWAVDALKDSPDFAKSDPAADADGDGLGNIHEWALMTKPKEKDGIPTTLSLEGPYEGGWVGVNLAFHRRRGSSQFVTLAPQISAGLDRWDNIPSTDWEAFLDPFGDRDGNPDTEEVLFRVWLNITDPGNAAKFFRVQSKMRAIGP